MVPRRAAGGPRALLRHHAGRPRAGCRHTPATSRSSPSTCTRTRSPARWRTRSTPSRRRSRRATGAGWRSCSGSGRSATARGRASSTTRPRSTSRRTAGSVSAAATTTPASTSAAPGRRRPQPRRRDEFLASIRAGRVSAHGEQGSAAKWAHAAMALAIRALGRGERTDAPDPAAVLRMVERVMTEGDARSGSIGGDLGPEDAQALLRAWLDAVDLPHERARPARPPPIRRLLARRARAPRAPRPRTPARVGRQPRAIPDAREFAAAAQDIFRPASPRSRTRPPPPSSAARRAS